MRYGGLVDTRPTEEIRVRRVQLDPSWLQKLLLWCQVCGAAADKPDLEYEIAWDLYLVVIVLAIAVIGVWECMKGCVNGREARLRALRGPSNKDGKSEPHEVGAERTPKAFGFEPTGLVG